MLGEKKLRNGTANLGRSGGKSRLRFSLSPSWIAALPLVMITACAPAATSVQSAAMPASNMAGVMVEVEGVDIWLDTLPTRTFSTVARNITPVIDGPAPIFPAQRMAAIAAAVQAQGGNAALVRTIEVPTAAGAGLFEGYRYEVDVIRYTQ